MIYIKKISVTKIVVPFCFLFSLTSHAFSAENFQINLSDAVTLALKNNRSIEQSQEDRESANWYLSATRRSFGPTLTWSGSSNKIGGRYYNERRDRHYAFEALTPEQQAASGYTMQDFPPYLSENTHSLSLSIPLYTGGRLEGQKKSAGYNLNTADLILENTRQQIKFQTTQAYFQALQYRDIMQVRQEEIQNLNEHLQNVQLQYEVGTVAFSDVLATNVQIANSTQSFNNAQANFNNAIANLNNIIGLPVDTPLLIDGDFKYSPFSNDENYCLEYALTHRPDGIAAAYAVKSSESAINQAKSGWRPNVSAVVSGNIVGEGAFTFKADHTNEIWAAGVQFQWNIFDNNVTSAQVQQAKSALRKTQSQANQQIEMIKLEVHTAYTNLRIAELNINIAAHAVSQANEQYLISKVRYEEGVDTNLTVMDAQEKLTQTRTNFSIALYDYNTAIAELEKAMGVPIVIDAAIYQNAVNNGKVSAKALEESKVN